MVGGTVLSPPHALAVEDSSPTRVAAQESRLPGLHTIVR